MKKVSRCGGLLKEFASPRFWQGVEGKITRHGVPSLWQATLKWFLEVARLIIMIFAVAGFSDLISLSPFLGSLIFFPCMDIHFCSVEHFFGIRV